MTAVLIALEGLTKEVARVRVRTAQLGDRNHTSDVRLTYVEDQTTRIKNKLKQLKVRSRIWTYSNRICTTIIIYTSVMKGRVVLW